MLYTVTYRCGRVRQQRDLVVEPQRLVHRLGFGRGDLLPHDRQVLSDDRAHALLDPDDLLVGEVLHTLDLAIESLGDRMLDMQFPLRKQVVDGLLQYEEQRALINAHSLEMRDVDVADAHRRVDGEVELLEPVVDIGGQKRTVLPLAERQNLGNLQQRSSPLTNRLRPVFSQTILTVSFIFMVSDGLISAILADRDSTVKREAGGENV